MSSSKKQTKNALSDDSYASLRHSLRNYFASSYLGSGSSNVGLIPPDGDIDEWPPWIRKYIMELFVKDLIKPVSEFAVQNEVLQAIRDEGILRQEIDSLLESTARMRADLEQIKVQLG